MNGMNRSEWEANRMLSESKIQARWMIPSKRIHTVKRNWLVRAILAIIGG